MSEDYQLGEYHTRAVLEAVTEVLYERAQAGNQQSKHGFDAAFDYEVFLFKRWFRAARLNLET